MATSPEMLRMMAEYQRDIQNEADRTRRHYDTMHDKLGDINKELKTASERMSKWMTDSKNFDLSPIKMGLEAMSNIPIAGFFAKWAISVEDINRNLKEFEGTFIRASAAFVKSGDHVQQTRDHWVAANDTLASLVGNLHVSEQAFSQLASSMNGLGHNYEMFNASLTSTDKNVSVLTATIQFAQATGQDYGKVLGDMSNVMLNFGSSSRDASKAMEGVHRGFTILASSAAQTGMPISYVQDQIMKATSGFEDYAVSVGSAMGGVAETFTNIFAQAQDQLGKQGRAGPLTQKLISGMTGMDLGTRGVVGEHMGLGQGLGAAGKYSVLRSTNMYEAVLGATDFITSKMGPGADKSYNALVGEGLKQVLSPEDLARLEELAGPNATGRQLMKTFTGAEGEGGMGGTINRDMLAQMNISENAWAQSTKGMKMYQQMFGLNEQEAIEFMDLQLGATKAGGIDNMDKESRKRYEELMKSSKQVQTDQLTVLQEISNNLASFLGGVGGIADLAKTTAGGIPGFLMTVMLEQFDLLEGDTLSKIFGSDIGASIGEALGQIPGFAAVEELTTSLVGGFGGLDGLKDLSKQLKEAVKEGFDLSSIAGVLGTMWTSISNSGFFDNVAGYFSTAVKATIDLGTYLWGGLKMLGGKIAGGTQVLGDAILGGLESFLGALPMKGAQDASKAVRGVRAGMNEFFGESGYSGAIYDSSEEKSKTLNRFIESDAMETIETVLGSGLKIDDTPALLKGANIFRGGLSGLVGTAAGAWGQRGAAKTVRGALESSNLEGYDKSFIAQLGALKARGRGADAHVEIARMLKALPKESVFYGLDPTTFVNLLSGEDTATAIGSGFTRGEERMVGNQKWETAQSNIEERRDQLVEFVQPAWDATKRAGGAIARGVPKALGRLASTGMDKAREVMKWLMSKAGGGYSAAAAAGLVGNIMVESDRFRADKEYGGGGGRGWMQWTGTRRKNFEAWAEANNMDPSTEAANRGFLQYEMEQGNEWTGGMSTEKFKGMNDPREAAEAFMRNNERPADMSSLGLRTQYANQLYAEATGKYDNLLSGSGEGREESKFVSLQEEQVELLKQMNENLTSPAETKVVATCDRCSSEEFKAASRKSVVEESRNGTYGTSSRLGDQAIM